MKNFIIEYFKIFILFCLLFIFLLFVKLFFVDASKAKINIFPTSKNFTQNEIETNNIKKAKYYENLQNKFKKINAKHKIVKTEKQNSFNAFRKLLE